MNYASLAFTDAVRVCRKNWVAVKAMRVTPRYSIEEINKAFASQGEYIVQSEAELKKLKERSVADG